jgi:hypothetical protein
MKHTKFTNKKQSSQIKNSNEDLCPDKGKIKAGAQKTLYQNKNFMALWQNSFADEEH